MISWPSLIFISSCSWFESPPKPPNLLLITVDTTRADHLSSNGYIRPTTPAIDLLASESIVFDRCISPIATTLPAHASLFTATFPSEHGVVSNIGQGGDYLVPSEKLTSFAKYLHNNGYQTLGVVSAAPLRAGTGIEAGFSAWDEPKKGDRARNAEDTTKALMTQMAKMDPKKPYFAWVHYYDPHSPYDPPDQFDRFKGSEEFVNWHRERRFSEESPNRKGKMMPVPHVIHAYDGELRYMDQQIGRLFVAMHRVHQLTNTIVMLVGDHGEGLGQHDHLGHGGIFNEQLHVPCMIRHPEYQPTHIPFAVSLTDMLPSLLGLVELPNEAEFLTQASGVDVLVAGHRPRPILSMKRWDQELGHDIPPLHSLTTATAKLVHNDGGADELYDLAADPWELTNIAAEKPK
ncbi:MAG: sulfatase, partial [Proteobacteria bacterium]|nr:sulfatase [Pseudomonadota bacterium]